MIQETRLCTGFAGTRWIYSGELREVAIRTKTMIENGEIGQVLIFDDTTGQQVEVDFRGRVEDVASRLSNPCEAPRAPGRPKLGVVGREVTLLPRHWDWLNEQPGGPSVTLRKLVEDARRAGDGDRARKARDAAYRFMTVMAGNEPGYEEAVRWLFAKGEKSIADLEVLIQSWPTDVRAHAVKLASVASEEPR